MTPKEKAISLVKKMSMSDSIQLNRNQYGIECALIAVDEMYNIAHSLDDMATVGYLIDVKAEIEKL